MVGKSIGNEAMLITCTRIRNSLCLEFVCPQIKGVGDNQTVGFDPSEPSYLSESRISLHALRKNQRHEAGCTFRQSKGFRGDIHLSIPDHDVAVGTEALHAFVLVNVIVVGVEEVTVTHHEVNYRILPLPSTLRDELGQVSWVAAKHIKDLPPVVVAARDLTIRVVVLFPPGPGKPL